ncbi:FbpB family small basic protein [Heyndrickxia sp. NPDC080065]
MRKTFSLKELVDKNKLEIKKDQKALEKIERKIDKKYSVQQ